VFQLEFAGFSGRGMPPGVLEPRTGGCIAAPGAKNKETGQNRPVSLSPSKTGVNALLAE
jgi:hypothetical protein